MLTPRSQLLPHELPGALAEAAGGKPSLSLSLSLSRAAKFLKGQGDLTSSAAGDVFVGRGRGGSISTLGAAGLGRHTPPVMHQHPVPPGDHFSEPLPTPGKQVSSSQPGFLL